MSIPEDSHVRAGSTLLIKCQASGVPHPKISWKRKRNQSNNLSEFVDIPDSDPHFRYGNSQIFWMDFFKSWFLFSLSANGNLIIANAKDSHEGDYLCQASNGIGSGKSKLVSLSVDGKKIMAMQELNTLNPNSI